MSIVKLLIIVFIVIFAFPAYAFLPGNGRLGQQFLPKSTSKIVYQRIYLKEKLANLQAIELLEILDTFDFNDLSIDRKRKSINMKYFSGFVNLAEVITTIKKLGYKVARLE